MPERGAAQAGGGRRQRRAAHAGAGRVRAGVPAARRRAGARAPPGGRLPALRAAGVRAVQPGRQVRRGDAAQPERAGLRAAGRLAPRRAGRAGAAPARAGLGRGARLGHGGRVARLPRGGPRARGGAGDAGRARAAAAAQHALRAHRGHARRPLRRPRPQRVVVSTPHPPLATSPYHIIILILAHSTITYSLVNKNMIYYKYKCPLWLFGQNSIVLDIQKSELR